MPLTNYFREKYIAPQLSEITEVRLIDISEHEDEWLSTFDLNHFRITWKEPFLQYIGNFLRRVEGAFHFYKLARSSLDEYIRSGKSLSRYRIALLYLESFLAQFANSADLLRWTVARMAGRDKSDVLYQKDDASPLDRMNKLYRGSKHSEEKLGKTDLPEGAMVPVWFTNDGIKGWRAEVTYAELAELMIDLANVADQLCNPPLAPPPAS